MNSFYSKTDIDIPNQTPDQKEFYIKRCSEFEKSHIGFDKIVFLGDSITEGGDWNTYFKTNRIKNRGISGDTTEGVLARLGELYYYKPKGVFLLIGINDIFNSDSPNRSKITSDYVANNIQHIAESIIKQSPITKLFVQTILPINNQIYFDLHGSFPEHEISLIEQIMKINTQLKDKGVDSKYTIIDLHSHFTNNNGKLDKSFTNDGVHLNYAGYKKWSECIIDYIMNL